MKSTVIGSMAVLVFFLPLKTMDETGPPATQTTFTHHYSSSGVKNIQLSTGVRLQYVEQGKSGIPVVFLHGYTDSWHSFQSVLTNLPANIHAFALTMRGHGDSDRPAEGYGVTDFSNDVVAFIKKLHLGPVVIVGHSMGGMVAQQFASSHPELTLGVVIISSDASFKDNVGMPEFEQQVNGLSDPISFAFADEFQRNTCATPIEPSYYQLLVKESLKLPARTWKSIMSGLMSIDLTPALGSIDKPTLIMWGDKDLYCSKTDQDVLLSGIKQSRLVIYEDTGHALHWEQPKRFAEDITNFVNQL